LYAWTASSGHRLVEENIGGAPHVDDLVVERLDLPADDGARDFARERTPLPTLLHAYGGFGINSGWDHSPWAEAWCRRGGRYVVAGIRGGREFGDDWHAAGMREHKERAFDDIADAARVLIARGATTPGQLCAWGSSNGGLLVCNLYVREPDLVAAVHASVPMTDMLGYRNLSIAALWESDFGDPRIPRERAWLRSWSPLHNIPEGHPLPALIVTTGAHDTRVAPVHSLAFTAAVQAHEHRGPVLLRVEPDGGHGPGKPVSLLIAEKADALAFLRSQLTPPPREQAQ
jgi:prolyl oligopeptidase